MGFQLSSILPFDLKGLKFFLRSSTRVYTLSGIFLPFLLAVYEYIMLLSSTLISLGILILAGAQLPLRSFSMVPVASSVISPSTPSFEMVHHLIQHLLVFQIIKFPCRHCTPF